MKAEEILQAAVEKKSPAERAAYLDGACGQDAELRAKIEALLRAHEQAGSFLEQPLFEPGPTIDQCEISERPGTVIGPYKLLEQIGEGGFGVVFMAEQTQPMRRKVALKVLKPGMDTRQVVARFEAERQALAIMDHPNIAKMLDGGATSSGRPFFVMDLVKGVPITEHCDQNHLTPRERLELFVSVCHAVQHAHQKGIIHRDLKPSNVLVTMHDTTPLVKVIDFGVAKALGQELTDKTLFTGFAQMIGTPLYMSPEQAGQSSLDIDTRSDIYSLGVLLYELLTGTTPFDKNRFKQAAYDEIRRIIREEEPPKPSTRLSELGKTPSSGAGSFGVRRLDAALPDDIAEKRRQAAALQNRSSLASIAAMRGLEPAKLPKLVRGELDWIVMKCLEKDRNRRYETAKDFAADVQRYLADEPVQACPPSAWYRFRKLVRRHKVALATTAVVAAALVLGTVVSLWQAFRATRAERLAQERLEAETTAHAEADRERKAAQAAQAEEATQRTVAQQNAMEADAQRRRAEANLQKAREAVDQMLTRVGESRLISVPHMEPVRKALLEDALKFYEGFLQQNSTDPAVRLGVGQAWDRLGVIHTELGQHAQAQKAFQESIALLEKLVADIPSEPSYRAALADAYAHLGSLFSWTIGDQRQAEGMFGQALALDEALDTEFPNRPEYRSNLGNLAIGLGTTLQNMGQLDDAEKALRRAVAVWQELAAEDPGWRGQQAVSYFRLGSLLAAREKPSEAEQAIRQSLAISDRLLAEDPTSRWTRHNLSEVNLLLANVLRDTGRFKEAEECYRSALAITQKLAADFPDLRWRRAHLGQIQLDLGQLLVQEHRIPEAEQVYRQANGTMESLTAQGALTPHWRNLLSASQNRLANLLKDSGRIEEAEQVRRQAVDSFEKLVAGYPEDPDYRRDLAGKHQVLGDLLRVAGRELQAAEEYRLAMGIYEKLAADFPNVADYRQELAGCHFGLAFWLAGMKDRTEDAEAAYRQAIDLYQQLTAETPTNQGNYEMLAGCHNNLGLILAGHGKSEEAEQAYQQAIAIKERLMAEDAAKPKHRRELARSLDNLGRLMAANKRSDEAEQAYRRAVELLEKLTADFPDGSEFRDGLALYSYHLAVLLAATGQTQEAENAYRKLIEQAPTSAVAHNNLAWLLATCPDPKPRDAGRAVELAKKAVELAPKEGNYWNTLGVAHCRAGEWKAAIEALEKSMELLSGKEESFNTFFLAITHWQLGEKDEAGKWYDQAVDWMEKNKPDDEELKRFRDEAAELLGVQKKPAADQTPPAEPLAKEQK